MAVTREHSRELSALARWRPLRLGAVVLALGASVPIARTLAGWAHFTREGLAVETDGASGRIAHGKWHMSLPVQVFNDTGRAITEVTLWVDAMACPYGAQEIDNCTPVASFAQVLPMYLGKGTSARFDDTKSGDIPAGAEGMELRIRRHIQSVRDDGPEPGAMLPDPATAIDGPIEHSEHH